MPPDGWSLWIGFRFPRSQQIAFHKLSDVDAGHRKWGTEWWKPTDQKNQEHHGFSKLCSRRYQFSLSSLASDQKHIQGASPNELKNRVHIVKLHTVLRHSGVGGELISIFEHTPWEFAKERSGFNHTFLQTKEKSLRIWAYLCVGEIWQIKFSG